MKVEIPPSEKPSKVTMQPSRNQSGRSHSTPSSHQVWRKKVETQPSERQSKVKMQPSKKQSMVKKQPSKKPPKQQSKQNVPSYHIVWDGMSKQNLLLLFLIKILLFRISNIVPTFALWCVLERILCLILVLCILLAVMRYVSWRSTMLRTSNYSFLLKLRLTFVHICFHGLCSTEFVTLYFMVSFKLDMVT